MQTAGADVTRQDYQTLFDRRASNYGQFRPGYPDSLFQFILSVTNGRDLAWDSGTGSGQAALSLAPYFRQVVATDASPAQLEHAAKHEKIQFSIASAESSPLANASCDLVTAANAVHWFDIERFFDEVHRVLKPDGVIAVWCYSDVQAENAILQEHLEKLKKTVFPYWPEPIRLVNNHYRELPFPFVEIPSPQQFSLTVEWTMDKFLGYSMTWSAAEKYRQANGTEPIQPWFNEIAEHYQAQPELLYKFTFPLHLRIGRNS